MARTRIRLSQVGGNSVLISYKNGSEVGRIEQDNNSSGVVILRDRCDDSTGSTTDHPCEITKYDNSGLHPLDGSNHDPFGNEVVYQSWFPTTMYTSLSHLATSAASVTSDATKALARTNPGRTTVSVPNFIHELKDLPGMYRDILGLKAQIYNLKNIQRYNPRVWANHSLSVQMGWLPLFSDLRKLITFQSSVDQRVQELHRLYDNGGLKRRINLGKFGAQDSASLIVESAAGTLGLVIAKRSKATSVERWATVRWKPTSLPKSHSPEALQRQARQLVFGLGNGISAQQAWNAIPWTWLIDWFANVDEFLGAHQNSVPVKAGLVNVMTRTTTTADFKRTDSLGGIKGGDGTSKLTTKARSQSGGGLSVGLPFLNGRQLSILGALAIQRMKR